MNKEEFKKHCELQAMWWIASATTGHAKSRNMSHIGEKDKNGNYTHPPFTNQEKIDDALNIAQNHIRLYRETCEQPYP